LQTDTDTEPGGPAGDGFTRDGGRPDLLEAAKAVFARSGVDAPAKEITDKADVGVGTLYRHFPHRSDLIAAVMQHEIDVCGDAGTTLGGEHEPNVALAQWLYHLTELVGDAGMGCAGGVARVEGEHGPSSPSMSPCQAASALQSTSRAASVASSGRRAASFDSHVPFYRSLVNVSSPGVVVGAP
jgi:AcrR family transcriptional regulator